MLLRHATPRKNLPSIRRAGLLTRKSRGRIPAVWLHPCGASPWAVLHTVKRHGGRVEDVVTIELDVPRGQLRRHVSHGRTLWYTTMDIPTDHFRRLIDFAEVAGPSADDAPEGRKGGW